MEKRNYFGLPVTLILAGSIILSGCGGSASDEKKKEDPAITSISGSAVDGYLRNAFVCLDENANNECDDGESYIKSSSDGSYELELPATIPAGATVLVVGGVDNATGKNFTGLLKAPMDKSATTINITPLTTMVTAQIQAESGDTTDAAKIRAAVKKVADTLGMDETKVTSDPVKEGGEVEKKALQIQKVIEVLTEAEKTSNDSSNVAGAIDKVTKALAKQFSGAQTDVAALASAVANDTDSGLERAQTVAAVAAAVATKIGAAADTDDVQAVADIVATTVKAQVEAAKTVDATSGAVTIGAVSAESVTAIDTSATAVKAVNIERLMNLIGYDGDSSALATALAAANITSDTTLAQFLVMVNAMSEGEMKTELLAALDQALAIEDSLGETLNASSILGKSMYQIASDSDWDDTLKKDVGYFIANRLTFDASGKLTFSDEQYDVDTNTWAVSTNRGDEVNYYWTGSKWCEGNESDETSTFEINTDGTLTGTNHLALTCDGVATDLEGSPFVLRLSAENDISDINKTVAPRNWGWKTAPFNVLFDTGSKEYVLGVTNSMDDPIIQASGHLAFGHQYATFKAMVDDAIANNYTFARGENYHLGFASTNDTATAGAIKEVMCDDNYQNCTVSSTYAGTWEVKSMNGTDMLVVYPSNTDRFELGEAFAIRNGQVEHAWIRGMGDDDNTMFFYNETAMDAIKSTIQNSETIKAGLTEGSEELPMVDEDNASGFTFYDIENMIVYEVVGEDGTINSFIFSNGSILVDAGDPTVDPSVAFGSYTISSDGQSLTLTGSENGSTFTDILTFDSYNGDYCANIIWGTGLNVFCGTYAAAQEVAASSTGMSPDETKTYLGGKTFYVYGTNSSDPANGPDGHGKWMFNADATAATIVDLNDGTVYLTDAVFNIASTDDGRTKMWVDGSLDKAVTHLDEIDGLLYVLREDTRGNMLEVYATSAQTDNGASLLQKYLGKTIQDTWYVVGYTDTAATCQARMTFGADLVEYQYMTDTNTTESGSFNYTVDGTSFSFNGVTNDYVNTDLDGNLNILGWDENGVNRMDVIFFKDRQNAVDFALSKGNDCNAIFPQ